MNGYSIISLISLCFYFLMFTTFLVARKSQRIVKSFLALLTYMILWSWGSLFMRMEEFPSPYFWHQISILGLLMLPAGYYSFFADYLGVYDNFRRFFWRVVFLLIFVFNCFTAYLIPLPTIIHEGMNTLFQYHYTNSTYFVFILLMLVVLDIAYMTFKESQKNSLVKQSLRPLLFGVAILLLGHFLATLPMFVGVPIDIIAGVINAFIFMYALYKKQIFKVTMLLSKANCYLISFLFCMILLANIAYKVQYWMKESLHLQTNEIFIIIVILVLLVTILIYMVLKMFLDNFFLQDEQVQSNALERYTVRVTQLLRVQEVFETLNELIRSVLKDWNMMAMSLQEDHTFHLSFSNNPLEDMRLNLKMDHPLVTYLEEGKTISKWEDFTKSNYYRGVWEREKQIFSQMNTQYVAPLMFQDRLIGILFFNLPQKKTYKQKDIVFIQSFLGITSISLNNAQKYEQAYMEARMDELTGVYNRKYFHELLDHQFKKHKDTSLALAIANVDDFRLYNQMYGQKEGDQVLKVLAHLFKTSIMDQGFVARIGEKEFGIILPDYDLFSAKALMESILEKLHHKDTSLSYVGHVTFSAGVCASPYLASSSHELLTNTEMAVSGVKRSGKNGVQMYSEEVKNRMKTSQSHQSQYDMYASTIYALTAAIDAKDHYTFSHSQNVAYYAKALANEMHLSDELKNIVYEAGLLHDIGKIGITENILNKSGRLTEEEYSIMKQHVENAVDIIHHLPAMEYVVPSVISHHERYDGNGYPRRLKGEEIPLLGRILCVADSFDAMISVRSYKEAMPVSKALSILEKEAGRQFDPKCVDAFLNLINVKHLEIRHDTTI